MYHNVLCIFHVSSILNPSLKEIFFFLGKNSRKNQYSKGVYQGTVIRPLLSYLIYFPIIVFSIYVHL